MLPSLRRDALGILDPFFYVLMNNNRRRPLAGSKQNLNPSLAVLLASLTLPPFILHLDRDHS